MALMVELLQSIVAIILFIPEADLACVNAVELGFESQKIKDSQIVTSSAINSNHTASEIRLNTGRGWCVTNDSSPFLTIDFGKLVTISKIATQGAYSQGEAYYMSNYTVKLGYSSRRWHDYIENSQPKEFPGDSNPNSIVKHELQNVMAQYMRIFPKYPESKNILCMRLEVYGCYSGYPPVINIEPSFLKLSNEETGSALCNVNGQVEMDVRLIKPANDVLSSDFSASKATRGIMHNESKTISFKKPNTIKVFDESCRLQKVQRQIVCQRNYSCRASYAFAKNLTNSRTIQVDFQRDVSLDININKGQLSSVEANIKSITNLTCQVRSQSPTSIRWINRINKKWTEKTYGFAKMEARLNYVRKSVLSLKPNAKDVINMLDCTLNGVIVCKTYFICTSNYIFNASITASESKAVNFLLELPGLPESPREECQSKECTVSWFEPKHLGGIPKSNLYYKVFFPKLKMSESVNSEQYIVKDLTPNTQYTVEIRAQVKNSRNVLLWESSPVTREFKTFTVAPMIAPTISNISTTTSSIYVQWQPIKLKPENGDVLKYDLDLLQLSYGGMKVGNILDMHQIIKFINVGKTVSSYTFRGLKPWSQYELSMKVVNTRQQSGKVHKQLITTMESVPTVTPSDITGGVIHPTYIELRWKEPPFKNRNGKITGYTVKWKSSSKSQRKTRDIEIEKTMRKSAIQLSCPECKAKIDGLLPYRQYTFRVAANTVAGSSNFSAPKILWTAQAAPSAPVSLSYNENRTTFFLMWKEPLIINGILKEYAINLKMGLANWTVFTESTDLFYDTKMNSSKTLLFKVRAYTENLHNTGGLAGQWSELAIAKRRLPPAKKPTGPKPKPQSNPTVTIVVSFVVILLLLFGLILLIFILYRRRQRRNNMQKLEVEMDCVVDDGEDEDINILPSERLPLTRNLGSHETVDVPVEDHAHKPVPMAEFAEYINNMREGDDDLFYNEYKNELMSGKCYPSEIAFKPENKPKNRYVNITAYDHSRVIVKPDGGKRGHHHHHETDYFNANYIEGYCPESPTKYIASHGPTESVVPDFWRMVWQEKSNVIVMLTNLEEDDKIKCHQYWPSAGAAKYGNVTVRFHSSDQTADYLVRTFEIEKVVHKEKEKRFVTQFHFVSWPDHGVPDFPTAILSLRRRVRHYYNGHSPMVVHCSAGVGRTGCFILVDAMLERIDNDEGTVDIFNYLQYMRTRRINMVQTLDQYIFAHTAVLEHITFGNTEISVIDLEGRVKELERNNGIEGEFELIESTSEDIASGDNVYKVLLKNGRFIDVFYVDGYKQQDAFFMCDSPSYNITPDFWKMLVERECHTIVMLNRLEEKDTYKYWPDLNHHQTYGDCTVLLASEHQNGNIMTRKFKITLEKGPKVEYEVQHFQFLEWPAKEIPNNRNSVLTLMSLIEKSQQYFGNAPVLVHSGKGAGRSGTFISIYNSTERLKVEQLIDVLQCVRAIRTVMAKAVETAAQYRFIYNMIRTYLEAFETYSNFQDPGLSTEDIS